MTQELINGLSVLEKKMFDAGVEQFNINSLELVEGGSNPYIKGYVDGYVFCINGFGSIVHSGIKESSDFKTQYVDGWYDGQLKARTEKTPMLFENLSPEGPAGQP